MYRIMRVKAGEASPAEEEEARAVKWKEVVSVMELLEVRVGWTSQDGTTAYTRDESESHESMVLGESRILPSS